MLQQAILGESVAVDKLDADQSPKSDLRRARSIGRTCAMVDETRLAVIEQDELMTPAAWNEFIDSELQSTFDAYLAKPAFLLGHSRTEAQTAADYAGRELLELVQNAADAASETGGAGRVLIEVKGDTLFVANTGQPFRKRGVAALMTAHTSDKPTRAARMIGAKGLGFRAILNWTNAPVISSGSLEIGFSRLHASALVAQLAARNSEIASNFSEPSLNFPPLLVFPATGNELERLGDVRTSDLLQHARILRAAGYDTVVAAPLRDVGALQHLVEQAGLFEPSFLLFVETLDAICIRLPDRDEKRWTKETKENGDVSLLLEAGEEKVEQKWILRQRRGSIGEGDASKEYELAIALRLDASNTANRLHSYFPTSLPLPFSGLFHATLELDSSRKTINEGSEKNHMVLAALGRFHADVLDELRKSKRVAEPLRWLLAHQAFPDALMPVARAAWERARQLSLERCMDGTWRSPEQARVGPAGYSGYLPQRLFGQLAIVSEPLHEGLLRNSLKVTALGSKEVLATLREADLSVTERAKAIAGIARALPENFHDSRLLIDLQGKSMPSTVTAFPPPTDEFKRQSLPNWANARFIHPDLWAELLTSVVGNTLREKLHALKGFRVVEYSADAVIAALRSKVTELLKKKKSNPDRLQASLLAAVYSLHDRNRNGPPGIFRVRCQDGVWRDITTVHLSESYGLNGRITAALYSGRPDVLIGTADGNGLVAAGLDAANFLEWLGLNRWPRQVTEDLPQKWRKAVTDDLPDTFEVSDGNTHRELRRDGLSWGYTVNAEHQTVYALEHILKSASSDAILAWIAHDPRLDSLAPIQVFDVKLAGRESGNAKFRPYVGRLPNTIRLEIELNAWLECTDGLPRSPMDVMIEPGLFSSLFHSPRAVDGTSEEAFGLSRPFWRRGLERAGVARTLDDLTEPLVYRLLSSLPERNVKPEVGSRLFLQVLGRDLFEPKNGGADRDVFWENGMLPVQFGGKRIWAERDGVHYAQRDDLPSVARSHLKLIDLPTRLNAKHVLARFGVPALQKDALDLRIRKVDEVVDGEAATLRARFERAKIYILALRKALSPNGTHLRRFEALGLQVALRAEMELSINGVTVVEELEPWRHRLSQDSLMITIDAAAEYEVIMALGLHAIADGFAELFELQSGADFVPYLTASTEALRRTHLQRALPSLDADELETLISGIDRVFDSPFSPEVDAETLAAGPAPSPAKPPAQADSLSGKNGSVAPNGFSDDAEENAALQNIEVSIEPRPAPTNALGTGTRESRRTLRVAAPTGKLADQIDADPERAADAEHWTGAFERANGRWPLSVAHLQGTRAFGCDYLSFDSEEDRASFVTKPERIDLVSRFIETKSGSVWFSDNEWIAASRLGELYFVYRLTFVAGGREQAQLTVVRNPLSRAEAIRTARELLIDKVPDREEFDLVQAGAAGQLSPTQEPVAETSAEVAWSEA